jgi:hypothetical protein
MPSPTASVPDDSLTPPGTDTTADYLRMLGAPVNRSSYLRIMLERKTPTAEDEAMMPEWAQRTQEEWEQAQKAEAEE